MPESYPHLPLPREAPVNEKRSRSPFWVNPPDDIPAHGRHLQQKLASAKEQVAEDVGGFDERLLFRFSVQAGFNPDDLRKISKDIEFVSQEDETIVVVFVSYAALEVFEARLATMVRGGEPTNKEVLYALQSVDGSREQDRKGWALKIHGFPEKTSFILDVELWPLEDPRERNLLWNAFENWLQDQDIESVDKVNQTGLILCRVRCNENQALLLLKNRDVRSVDLPPSFGLEQSLIFQDIQRFPVVDPPAGNAPGVVVLDSGLVAGHPLLGVAVGDSQSFLPGEDASDEHGHGTHVAGLALYGDFEASLRAGYFVPVLRLFSGRILDKNNENSTGFVENHISKAVNYFVDRYHCRIFNLSYGDRNKPYLGGHLKGLSFVLDSLSRKLGVLFVVSSGNHVIGDASPEGLDWKRQYPDYLLKDAWKIIEPAPALNVLTVGSLARHDRTFNSQRYPLDPAEIPISQPDQPSPFTRTGYSVDGAIKPELMAYGGNWAINTRGGANRLLNRGNGLGVISTSRQFAGGNLFSVDCGTSMAAPQVAHLAASILNEHPDASANLLRALLCVNAVIPDASKKLIECQTKPLVEEKQKIDRKRKEIQGQVKQGTAHSHTHLENLLARSRELADLLDQYSMICGYGQVDTTVLHRSLENAVTLIANATIENKRHHFYEIPVPDDFVSTGKCFRDISVALAYTPVVRSTRIKYRATRIDFKLVAAPDLRHVITMFNKATEKKVYDRILEFKPGLVGQKARNKGTVQADTWRFKRFDEDAKLKKNRLFIVVTRNDFPWGEPLCATEEGYSLVVCLRDRKNEEVRLYTQVRNQLQARMPARVKV